MESLQYRRENVLRHDSSSSSHVHCQVGILLLLLLRFFVICFVVCMHVDHVCTFVVIVIVIIASSSSSFLVPVASSDTVAFNSNHFYFYITFRPIHIPNPAWDSVRRKATGCLKNVLFTGTRVGRREIAPETPQA